MSKTLDIIRQKFLVNYDKNKNLLLQSIKIFSNNKQRVDKVTLTKSQVNELKKQKQREAFMFLLTKKFDVVAKLNCDAKAKKNHLCRNTAYCTTTDNVAKFLANDSVKYVNAHTRAKKVKTVKKVKTAKVKTAKVKTAKKS